MNLKYKFISDKTIRESTGYQDDNERVIFIGDGLWITFDDTPEESFSGFVKKIDGEFYLQREEFEKPEKLGEIINSVERNDDRRDFHVMVIRNETLPKNWWTFHHQDCGTKYRGCHPDCPKDVYEKTGIWKI